MKYALLALSILLSFPTLAASSDPIEIIEVSGQTANVSPLSPKGVTVNGPFGDGLALSDIARSVTPISSEMIEQLNLTSLQDMLAVTPNHGKIIIN